MGSNLSRRDLLKLAAVVPPLAMPLAGVAAEKPAPKKPEPGTQGLSAYQDGPQVWVRWNNRLLTSYRAHPTQKYPYLYPLAGPVTGLSLTAETAMPYPHHRSVLFGCDRVNGGNYWQDSVEQGQIVSLGPKLGKVTERTVEIADRCSWRKPGQKPVMADERKILVNVLDEKLILIDFEIRWIAVEDVTVQKTNHSLFAVRAAADLAPTFGGNLANSEGDKGEKATFGKPAGWCAFWGKRRGVPGDVVEGIALLDHPSNPWKQCPWFTRDYGFISPSPMNFMNEPWRLAAGKSVVLRYRVAIFAGDPTQARLPELYRTWIEPS
jgi:hypothetical protein